MNINKSIDIEDEVRKALTDYITVYVRPLPEKFTVPSVLIEQMGGTTENTIDSFLVRLSARATTEAEALELANVAVGILERQCAVQFGALRHMSQNSLASWGNDPIRPDLKLATATVQVIAHKESFDIEES